jgi:mannose-1-phosphate guanylyltransferase
VKPRSFTAGGKLWGIVLAGGEGTRLAGLTRAVYGHNVPKPFAALGSDRTFLEETLDRIAPLVPRDRTLVVVSEAHADLAREQLADYPGVRLILQPTNRGTTAGVLLPLVHVLAADPEALVAVFPCDHRFRRKDVFLEAVRAAVAAAREPRAGVTLVGAAPQSAAADLGWIVPRRSRPSTSWRRVSCFVEKPSSEASWALLRRGGLWNTLVLAARAAVLWRAAERHVPLVAGPLARYRAALPGAAADKLLREIYETLPASDLSRDLLQVARGLRVVPMIDSGWSDCGTPERLFGWLGPREARRLRLALRKHADLARPLLPNRSSCGAPVPASGLPQESLRTGDGTALAPRHNQAVR